VRTCRYNNCIADINSCNDDVSKVQVATTDLLGRGDFRVILLSLNFVIFFCCEGQGCPQNFGILRTRLSQFWSKCVDQEGWFFPQIF
jgi:hypothetical protein